MLETNTMPPHVFVHVRNEFFGEDERCPEINIERAIKLFPVDLSKQRH
jgi:hypothetical protein